VKLNVSTEYSSYILVIKENVQLKS